jgi:hypothetical protein
MKTLPDMLVRMYSMSVWDEKGRQFLPIFDYEWRDVMGYQRADEAITNNTQNWINDHPEENG